MLRVGELPDERGLAFCRRLLREYTMLTCSLTLIYGGGRGIGNFEFHCSRVKHVRDMSSMRLYCNSDRFVYRRIVTTFLYKQDS
jgi:hypothetical protein